MADERDWRADPRVGDLIRLRRPRHALGRVPRRIVEVDGDTIRTVGTSGDQRDRSMGRARLGAYDIVKRAEQGRTSTASDGAS